MPSPKALVILGLQGASLISAFAIPQRGFPHDRLADSQKPFGSVDKLNSAYLPSSSLPLDEWLKKERKDAFDLLLANIGPNGANVPGAAAGAVIASPSRQSPNYFYQWIRDAAITIGTVVNEYERTKDDKLLDIIESYVQMQMKLQHTDNPSGGYRTGGLGEPKFEADGSAFWGNWGRVQNDGPALRAITVIKYLNAVNSTYPSMLSSSPDWLESLYDGKLPTFSAIKADLEYVATAWQRPGFDLWEEVNGLHFFTAMTQLRAMADGRDTARSFNDSGAAAWYEIQRQGLEQFVKKFWDSNKGHLVSTLDSSRTGLDCALPLAALHGGSDDVFPPWSDEVLISTYRLLEDMKTRHRVNNEGNGKPGRPGWGIGRYPEDIYDGTGTSRGNPWFLCTSSVSEIFYRTISHFIAQGAFEITYLNLPFFQNVFPNARIGKITKDSMDFNATLVALNEWADGFLDVVKTHAMEGGRLSEQFDGNAPGYQKGAKDLTWSYGSLIEALEKRQLARRDLGLD